MLYNVYKDRQNKTSLVADHVFVNITCNTHSFIVEQGLITDG